MTKKKDESKPEEQKDESVPFLLTVAENALRDALKYASTSSHAIQLESLADSLLCVAQAKFYFNKPTDYFEKQAEENG